MTTNANKTWYVYDTDGDGEPIPETYKDCGDYQSAYDEWSRRLWGNDYSCLGFYAGPQFTFDVYPINSK